MNQGEDAVILAVGPLVFTAREVALELARDGISCEVVNCRFIKPMDEQYLSSIPDRFDYVITVEEGVITGGFGDGVAAWLLENGYKGIIKRLGLPDSFVEHGSRAQIMDLLGLDKKGLIHTIKELIPVSEILKV
tara:strand:- start:549 stop:950 length:402 start_codon:yes stop_codon:yes gene_type:complete